MNVSKSLNRLIQAVTVLSETHLNVQRKNPAETTLAHAAAVRNTRTAVVRTNNLNKPYGFLHADRRQEISSDFVKMNSSAYVVTLEFIFHKSAQASRISKIGLPVIYYSYKLNF